MQGITVPDFRHLINLDPMQGAVCAACDEFNAERYDRFSSELEMSIVGTTTSPIKTSLGRVSYRSFRHPQ